MSSPKNKTQIFCARRNHAVSEIGHFLGKSQTFSKLNIPLF